MMFVHFTTSQCKCLLEIIVWNDTQSTKYAGEPIVSQASIHKGVVELSKNTCEKLSEPLYFMTFTFFSPTLLGRI